MAVFDFSHQYPLSSKGILAQLGYKIDDVTIGLERRIDGRIRNEINQTALMLSERFDALMSLAIESHPEYGEFSTYWIAAWKQAYAATDPRCALSEATGVYYPEFTDFLRLGTPNDIVAAQKFANEARVKDGPPSRNKAQSWRILWLRGVGDRTLEGLVSGIPKFKTVTRQHTVTKWAFLKIPHSTKPGKVVGTRNKAGKLVPKLRRVASAYSLNARSFIKKETYNWTGKLTETITTRQQWFLANKSAGFYHQIIDGNLGSGGAYPMYGPNPQLFKGFKTGSYLPAIESTYRELLEEVQAMILAAKLKSDPEILPVTESAAISDKLKGKSNLRIPDSNIVLRYGTLTATKRGKPVYVELPKNAREEVYDSSGKQRFTQYIRDVKTDVWKKFNSWEPFGLRRR